MTNIDPKLIGNPWYWLYRVTQEQDQELVNLFWNRLTYEFLKEKHKLFLKNIGIEINLLNENEKDELINKINDAKKLYLRGLYPSNTAYEFIKLTDFSNVFRTSFFDCTWNEKADFSEFIFLDFIFHNVNFMKEVYFNNVIFLSSDKQSYHLFDNIKFDSDLYFQATHFTYGVQFDLKVRGSFNFDNCHLSFIETDQSAYNGIDDINFIGSIFYGDVFFSTTVLSTSKVSFMQVHFKGSRNHFTSITNEGFLSFELATFDNTCNFTKTHFEALPDFTGTEFRGGIDLTETMYPDNPHGNLDPRKAQNTWRKFRQCLKDHHNRELENEILINEFDAELYNPNSFLNYQTTFDLLPSTFNNSTFWNKITGIFLYLIACLKKAIMLHWDGIFCVLCIYLFSNVILKPIYDFNTFSLTISIIILIVLFSLFNRLGDIPYRKVILSLYRLVSLYGTSFKRPLFLWFVQIFIFACFYYSFTQNNENSAWRLSITEASIITSSHDKNYYQKLVCENFKKLKHDTCNTKDIELIKERYTQFPLLRYLQKIISGVLIFLFGLGLRNYLKIR